MQIKVSESEQIDFHLRRVGKSKSRYFIIVFLALNVYYCVFN